MLTSRKTGVIFVGYRVLYFYKKENTFYREKNGGNISFAEKELGGEEAPVLKAFYCGVPEYYGKQRRYIGYKKSGNILRGWGRQRKSKNQVAPDHRAQQKDFMIPWNFGQLLRLLQNCCEYVSADACYLEAQFEKELVEGGFGFMPGRQRMCGELIKRTSGQFRGIDGILYLGEASENREEELPLPEELLRKLRYFFYLGEKSEQYDIMEGNLWREYGMPVLSIRKAEELVTCRIRRLLVLDDRQEGSADWEMLPGGCVYLDLWSDEDRREQIAKNRADIKYISEYQYLRRNLDTR